jgi:integrase
MSRTLNRLPPRFAETVDDGRIHADGGGLYLSNVRGAKRWIFVFYVEKVRRELGLGTFPKVSLARARQLATECREHLAHGRNPIEVRRSARAKAAAKPAPVLTFGAFGDEFIASVEEGWRNEVHRRQWRQTLRDHAAPLRDRPIAEIHTDDVLSVLQPIWTKNAETASRLRGRIERILSAAKARGHRPMESINPAAWKGHLEVLLPKRQRLQRGHHPAMPYGDLPAFIRELEDRDAMTARALQFLILNASRSGEVLGARWAEVDGDTWTIPADRMKAGVAHTVTLSPRARALLAAIGARKPDDYIFHGEKAGLPLSNMALQMLMRRMKVSHFTPHGFRSSFKDWALNCTEFPDEISEEALAHIVGSKVRRAYRRGEALDRRRRLMEAWALYLDSAPVAPADDFDELLSGPAQ